MANPSQHQPKVRFGPFEVDSAAGELRKHGIRIKLQKQPFQILSALLERPNEVLGREELRQKIWSNDTFVDFDHGVNSATNKIRQALGDSSENPRYIETIPGTGYRLLGPVEPIAEASTSEASLSAGASEPSAVVLPQYWNAQRLSLPPDSFVRGRAKSDGS